MNSKLCVYVGVGVLLANLSIVNCFTCRVLVINHIQLVLCRVNQVLLYCDLSVDSVSNSTGKWIPVCFLHTRIPVYSGI